MLAVSGMYFDPKTRGIEGDLAWVFDRRGVFKHAIGVSIVGFNETSQNVSSILNSNGDPAQTRTETSNLIKLYVGPSYFLSWKDISIQGGAGFRTTPDAPSSMRILFQLGYTPAFQF